MRGKPSDEICDKSEVVVATLKKKKKKINHSKLGPDFVAPEFETGWGWFICVAAGFSNVSLKLNKSDKIFIELKIITVVNFPSATAVWSAFS